VKFAIHQQEDRLFQQLRNILTTYTKAYNQAIENAKRLKAICDRKQIDLKTDDMNKRVQQIIEEMHFSLAGVRGNSGETEMAGADGDVQMGVAGGEA
jgi:flagellin-specific chaperone FliS